MDGPTADDWTAAAGALTAHEQAAAAAKAAQDAWYETVRALKRKGASRSEIADRLGLTDSVVKWIVEDKAGTRLARRRARRGDPQ
ncbi:hypothetical protein AB0F17_28605 [Nonomuraea sp. NPDC026600]|uniref:hypothetical protein n=1 Tax=Nonomuraea sp. NPDC026600 TaxID=3155363 RepID=UPI0033CAF372